MELLILSALLAVLSAAHAQNTPNTVFDTALYERVLDPELCDQQVRYLRNDTMLNLKFIDAGIRFPRSFLLGNTVDLGNYYQCLGIDEVTADYEIQGKYCMVQIPLDQEFEINIPGISRDNYNQLLKNRIKKAENTYVVEQMINHLRGDFERSNPDSALAQRSLRLGVCIPRPCSVQQAMTSALLDPTAVGLNFHEEFCRLPQDKPWSPADYTAVVLFSIIGLITILSTCYDLNHTFILKRDPKEASVLYRSFSVYTNGKRLTSFPPNPNTLQCLDGIRTLAMLWVILGHTFITENVIINVVDIFTWIASARALYITVAPFTVDTFFFITGALLVYTTAGKLTPVSLIKNLHLFYLNRLLRLFPLLALTVLLQASLLNLIFDGPYWNTVAGQVQNCRQDWWTTLLHIQNYATRTNICVAHSWYMAIDVQLHIVSPIVLYWVLNKNRKVGWIALIATLTVLFSTTTYYNVYNEFPGNNIVLSRRVDDYMTNYYMNTFTRAAPFFVGMIFGCLLNKWKGKSPQIHPALVALLWALTFAIFGLLTYAIYEVVQESFDNLVLDAVMTTYSRSFWAAALGWLIFACVHGYGGPINWFLSLDMWKLPSRLSYAMFLLHFPLQFSINSTELAPVHFIGPALIFKSLAYATLTFVVSFFACLLVDAPCSVLIKMALGGGVKREKPAVEQDAAATTKEDLPSEELVTSSYRNRNVNSKY